MIPLSYLPFNTQVWLLTWQIAVNYYKLNQTVTLCAPAELDVAAYLEQINIVAGEWCAATDLANVSFPDGAERRTQSRG